MKGGGTLSRISNLLAVLLTVILATAGTANASTASADEPTTSCSTTPPADPSATEEPVFESVITVVGYPSPNYAEVLLEVTNVSCEPIYGAYASATAFVTIEADWAAEDTIMPGDTVYFSWYNTKLSTGKTWSFDLYPNFDAYSPEFAGAKFIKRGEPAVVEEEDDISTRTTGSPRVIAKEGRRVVKAKVRNKTNVPINARLTIKFRPGKTYTKRDTVRPGQKLVLKMHKPYSGQRAIVKAAAWNRAADVDRVAERRVVRHRR